MIPIAVAFLMSGQQAPADSISDLSKVLFDVTQRSAIVVLPTYSKVSIATEPKIVDDLVSPLRKLGFASLTSDVAVIYQMGIPDSHLGVLKGLVSAIPPIQGAFKEVTIPQTAVKDNQISFETKPGEAIKVSTLMNLDLTRRIMVSPYYSFDNSGDFPLAMTAKNMPVAEFVKALTRGLSGKLKVEAKTYTIGFDAASFRTNFVKVLGLAQKGVDAGKSPSGMAQQYAGGTYSDYQEFQDAAQPAQSSSKPSLTAALTLLGQAINQMNDQLLEQTFAYKGTTTRLNLSNFTGLQASVINYLRSSSPAAGSQTGADVQRNQRATPNLAALINRVDPQNPGRLNITTDFRISAELNLMQNRRRQGQVDAANTVTIQIL